MKKITVLANAKVNLFLDVIARRENGFHDIKSVMQSISLCDEIDIEESNVMGVKFSCSDPSLPTGKENLAVAAAELFIESAGIRSGVKIHLKKQIPSQAGMAGGSSDAAAVLRGMNKLFDTGLGSEELCKMAERLGSDVPFCVLGGTCLAEGRGERLTSLEDMPKVYFTVAKCSEAVSTPAAYRELDSLYDGFVGYEPRDIAPMLEALASRDAQGISRELFNIFEGAVLPSLPETKKLLKILSESARGVLLSGSGSAVFGIFGTEAEAEAAAEQIRNNMPEAFVSVCTSRGKENV